jgi:Zn-dependent peptidase ImmA (M78 family)
MKKLQEKELPPTRKGRDYELKAQAIRDFAGLERDDEPLNPFELASYAKLLVASFNEILPFLSEETKRVLLSEAKDSWSGGVCLKPLPDGRKLIILNPTHGENRQNATLMEEICHVFLGHKPSKIIIHNDQINFKNSREYNPKSEEEAYSVGAAALVPYSALRKMISQGKSSQEIAQHFKVSRDLVEYRMKVTRLWKNYLQGKTKKE